jgi:hypothetical protein
MTLSEYILDLIQSIYESDTFADLHPSPNKWTKIPLDTLKKAKHEPPINIDTELFDLLQKTYAYIGGHVDFQKPSDLPGNHTIWYGMDIDRDKIPDIVRFGKQTPYGIKWTGIGTNMTPEAKQKAIVDFVDTLRKPGSFGEVSDALMHILITRYKIPYVDDQQKVEKIIGKKIKWIGPHPQGLYPGYNGFYERNLAGEDHMKILLGHPKS